MNIYYYFIINIKRNLNTLCNKLNNKMDGKKYGKFAWDDTVLEVFSDRIEWEGNSFKIIWVNDGCFYHKEKEDWWYYIWNGSLYHCIKYVDGAGWKEIKPL
jgi:hypothetical protein